MRTLAKKALSPALILTLIASSSLVNAQGDVSAPLRESSPVTSGGPDASGPVSIASSIGTAPTTLPTHPQSSGVKELAVKVHNPISVENPPLQLGEKTSLAPPMSPNPGKNISVDPKGTGSGSSAGTPGQATVGHKLAQPLDAQTKLDVKTKLVQSLQHQLTYREEAWESPEALKNLLRNHLGSLLSKERSEIEHIILGKPEMAKIEQTAQYTKPTWKFLHSHMLLATPVSLNQEPTANDNPKATLYTLAEVTHTPTWKNGNGDFTMEKGSFYWLVPNKTGAEWVNGEHLPGDLSKGPLAEGLENLETLQGVKVKDIHKQIRGILVIETPEEKRAVPIYTPEYREPSDEPSYS